MQPSQSVLAGIEPVITNNICPVIQSWNRKMANASANYISSSSIYAAWFTRPRDWRYIWHRFITGNRAELVYLDSTGNIFRDLDSLVGPRVLKVRGYHSILIWLPSSSLMSRFQNWDLFSMSIWRPIAQREWGRTNPPPPLLHNMVFQIHFAVIESSGPPYMSIPGSLLCEY